MRNHSFVQVNLGMWPIKLIVLENQALFWRVSTHIHGISKERTWENIHFSSKPRCVTPQIDHLGKPSPVLMVSTHIYGVSKEINGKTFIFEINLGHVTPQIDHLRKRSPVLRVPTHIYGISPVINGKSFICWSKPKHVTPQIDHLEKIKPCSEGFNTHLWDF